MKDDLKTDEKPKSFQDAGEENTTMMRTLGKRSWAIGGTLVLIIVAVGMFLLGVTVGGAMHRSSAVAANTNQDGQFDPMNGQGRFGGTRQVGVRGTVTAIDSDSITLQLNDSTTKTYTIDNTTIVRAQASGDTSVSDIKVGMTVAVRVGADTSSAASSIVIFNTNTSDSNSGTSQSY